MVMESDFLPAKVPLHDRIELRLQRRRELHDRAPQRLRVLGVAFESPKAIEPSRSRRVTSFGGLGCGEIRRDLCAQVADAEQPAELREIKTREPSLRQRFHELGFIRRRPLPIPREGSSPSRHEVVLQHRPRLSPLPRISRLEDKWSKHVVHRRAIEIPSRWEAYANAIPCNTHCTQRVPGLTSDYRAVRPFACDDARVLVGASVVGCKWVGMADIAVTHTRTPAGGEYNAINSAATSVFFRYACSPVFMHPSRNSSGFVL